MSIFTHVGTCGIQERASDSLDLRLQATTSCPKWVQGSELCPLWEHYLLLTTEPSLSSLLRIILTPNKSGFCCFCYLFACLFGFFLNLNPSWAWILARRPFALPSENTAFLEVYYRTLVLAWLYPVESFIKTHKEPEAQEKSLELSTC